MEYLITQLIEPVEHYLKSTLRVSRVQAPTEFLLVLVQPMTPIFVTTWLANPIPKPPVHELIVDQILYRGAICHSKDSQDGTSLVSLQYPAKKFIEFCSLWSVVSSQVIPVSSIEGDPQKMNHSHSSAVSSASVLAPFPLRAISLLWSSQLRARRIRSSLCCCCGTPLLVLSISPLP